MITYQNSFRYYIISYARLHRTFRKTSTMKNRTPFHLFKLYATVNWVLSQIFDIMYCIVILFNY